MKKRSFCPTFWVLLALALLASACSPVMQAANGAKNHPTGSPAEPQPNAARPTAGPQHRGYVLFDPQKAEFNAYDLNHARLFTSPAPGIQYPSAWTTEIAGDAIYLMTDKGQQIIRSTADGVTRVDVGSQNITAFAVSPDEKIFVWSYLDPKTGTTTLSAGDLLIEQDSLRVQNGKQVASYPVSGMQAFLFLPFGWLPDGRLLVDRTITGIGGYILYGGHYSLYTYDPASGQIDTVIPAGEIHGLCLDSYRPDLSKVVFNCNAAGQGITVRDLNDLTEKSLPALPEQGTAGSARYSPSGQWLAYAVARNNSEDEAGQVVVIPADLNAKPRPIAQVDQNTFPYVHGWLDEDTLLFSRMQMTNGTVWSVRRDGSDLRQVNTGSWIGWLD